MPVSKTSAGPDNLNISYLNPQGMGGVPGQLSKRIPSCASIHNPARKFSKGSGVRDDTFPLFNMDPTYAKLADIPLSISP